MHQQGPSHAVSSWIWYLKYTRLESLHFTTADPFNALVYDLALKMSKHQLTVKWWQNMGFDVTKPIFGVSDKARLKPVSSATDTSWKIEISLQASLDMILSKKRIKKVLIRLREWAGWSAPLLFAHPQDRFSLDEAHIVPYFMYILVNILLNLCNNNDQTFYF